MWQLIWCLANILMQNNANIFFLFLSDTLYVANNTKFTFVATTHCYFFLRDWIVFFCLWRLILVSILVCFFVDLPIPPKIFCFYQEIIVECKDDDKPFHSSSNSSIQEVCLMLKVPSLDLSRLSSSHLRSLHHSISSKYNICNVLVELGWSVYK